MLFSYLLITFHHLLTSLSKTPRQYVVVLVVGTNPIKQSELGLVDR